MRQARYYIHRNLHTGGYSVKYKGRVIEHLDSFIAFNVNFVVSKAGNNRCRETGQRNVHAYAVCDSYKKLKRSPSLLAEKFRVTYRPFVTDFFFVQDGLHKDLITASPKMYGHNGQIYVDTWV